MIFCNHWLICQKRRSFGLTRVICGRYQKKLNFFTGSMQLDDPKLAADIMTKYDNKNGYYLLAQVRVTHTDIKIRSIRKIFLDDNRSAIFIVRHSFTDVYYIVVSIVKKILFYGEILLPHPNLLDSDHGSWTFLLICHNINILTTYHHFVSYS